MSEFRQDKVSKQWVLFAPDSGKGFRDFKTPPATPDPKTLSEVAKTCVFCPGNESNNQEIASYPQGKDWKVRIIPNKFEILGQGSKREKSDFYTTREGIGDHEIIITRPHNVLNAFLPDDVMDLNLRVFQERMRELSQDPEVQYVHLVHNHGRDGGAVLIHPHSQIFATPFVPDYLHQEVTSSYQFYHEHGACVYCETILKEFENQNRIVLDHKDFLVFAPFASKSPYALRIISKTHRANFMEISTQERHSLALVLKFVLQKLYYKLGNPAFNYFIHTMPVSHKLATRYDPKSYHWHLDVLPRLKVWGGLELGSDVYVNTILPEVAADVFRSE